MQTHPNEPEPVLVSACLCGDRCLWHGKARKSAAALRKVAALGAVRIVKACPEMLGGLPCPRPPVKKRRGRVFETCEDKARRPRVTGPERTEEFRTGAEKVLAICRENGVKRAVFCSFSPSCDRNGICGKLLAENGVEVLNTF
jgi:uncharacterized protein YbbK (DUF523 family)